MKSLVCQTLATAFGLAITLLAIPAEAVVNELVGSSESHSIEKFNSSGIWLRTFASTGPWIPFGLAVSPVTHDVFVATQMASSVPLKENVILRYTPGGGLFGPGGKYWSTFDLYPYFGVNPVESLLFDSSGNLYVASHYGTSGYQVVIQKFLAAQLLNKTPVPSGTPILTTVGRGNQMAWDRFGNICIASFIAPNTVQCYDPSTAVLTYDYASEFAGFVPAIQPVGLAFGPNNNLYVTSVFSGQLLYEQTEHAGPMTVLTSGLISDIDYITTDSIGALYLTSFHNAEARYGGSPFCSFYACMDYDTRSDVIYKIDPTSGSVTNFITNHIWGPYHMVFVPF